MSDKRTQLLEASVDLFAEEGFWNTPTTRIAKHAGVGTGTLFNYFGSKEGLIDAVYLQLKKEWGEHILTGWPESGSVRDQLEHMWFRYLDFGRVDVVLNNAGYAALGPFEAATQEQIERQFDTNVIGLMRVTQAFLPHFRTNNDGLFLNVSSIGGRVTFPFISLYHGTKWAVEGFSESLAYELGELGIQVKLIEPGGVDTDFNGRSMDFCLSEDLTDYSEPMGKFQANVANSGLTSSTPEHIAAGIYNAATDGKAQLRYLLGPDAEQTYAMREQVGDDAFIAGMKQRIFGESETSFSQN